MKLVRKDWIQDLYYHELKQLKLKADEFYWEDGKMVMTKLYHKRRGYCCNNGCKHCAYKDKE